MINAYYFRLKGALYKEIVRLIPDIYILKNINLDKNLKFTMKNIECSIIKDLKKIYINAELTLEEEKKISIPLLIFNNYFNLGINYNSNGQYFSHNEMLLYYLTINNKNKIKELFNNIYSIPNYTNDYYNYYLLRDSIKLIINTYFEKNRNNEEEIIGHEIPKSLIQENIEKMNISFKDKELLKEILELKNNIKFPINKLRELTDYFNGKVEYKNSFNLDCINITKILIDILVLNKTLYLRDNNITYYLNELFKSFYYFIFSILKIKDIWKMPQLKKMLIYLLTPLDIIPIPNETKIFKLYNNFPCFILSKNSFVFFSKIKENNIFCDKFYNNLKFFDTELNYYIISYDNAIDLFRDLVSRFLMKFYHLKYNIIEYPIIYLMNDKVESTYDKNINMKMPLYFNILFYINTISQKLFSNSFDSQYIIDVSKKTVSKNALINYKKNLILFDIDHYLLSLFYYGVKEKDILLKTYLKYFEPKIENKDFTGKTIALCLLFAEIFKSFKYFKDISFLKGILSEKEFNENINIIKIFEYFSNINKNKFYLKENNIILNVDKNNEDSFIKPSLITSIILLKRALPYVLIYMNDMNELLKDDDKIKIYDFNNKLVDYDSLDDIEFIDEKDENQYNNEDIIYENSNDNFYNNNNYKPIKQEFIENFFKLLNYTLDEIVFSSNKNYCVYDISGDIEFEKIQKNKFLSKMYNIKEYCQENDPNKKEILKERILNKYFNNNFLNCYSRKNEWLLVRYIREHISGKKPFQYEYNFNYDDEDEDYEDDDENEDKKEDINSKYGNNNLQNKAIKNKEKINELINKLSINWNFTFIEYNLFLIYITLNEFEANIKSEKKFLFSQSSKKENNIYTLENNFDSYTLLKNFIREYENRDFFYLLKELILDYNVLDIQEQNHKFIWISKLNKKIEFIKPDVEKIVKLNKKDENKSKYEEEIEFEQEDEFDEFNVDKKSNIDFPQCVEKEIVYEGIPKQIKSFIFDNYSQKEEEKYLTNFNYIYNHIELNN